MLRADSIPPALFRVKSLDQILNEKTELFFFDILKPKNVGFSVKLNAACYDCKIVHRIVTK